MVCLRHPFFILRFNLQSVFDMNQLNLTDQPGPIAVFDSGYGGLTVLKDLLHYFPEYDFIYLGDNARAPYGNRSFDVVYKYTLEAVKMLFSLGAHLVILACNTASAKALRTIQQKDLPQIDPNRRVLGVIRPSVEMLASNSHTGHVGILGTEGTVLSNSYPLEISKLSPHLKVTQEACPMWVPLVENNEFKSEGASYFVKKNLNSLMSKDPDIDTVVLGCTHYPLLLPMIKIHLPKQVKIISQGSIVAKSLEDYLVRHPEMEQKILKNSKCAFYTSEQAEKFDTAAALFMGREVKSQTIIF